MPFDEPSDPDFFVIKDHVSALVIIAVNEFLPNFVTSMGPGKAVRAEVVIVDGPGAGKRFPDALFFGKKIVPQLSGSIGSVVLGRIVQGQAKAGQSAPYQLAKATAQDAAMANDYVKKHGDVVSVPVDTGAQGHGYAPDNEQWRGQQQAPATAQPVNAGPPQGYPQGQWPAAPAPATYASAGAPTRTDDEPPF